MNLQDILAAGMLKKGCMQVVNWVGSDRARFEKLFSLFTGPDQTIARRASWPLSYIARAHPQLFHATCNVLLRKLSDPEAQDSIKRHSLVIFEHIDIPVRCRGKLMTRCFELLLSPPEKPGVKVFALAVLRKLALWYPDILPELNTIISAQWDQESKAFRARARQYLDQWSSEISTKKVVKK